MATVWRMCLILMWMFMTVICALALSSNSCETTTSGRTFQTCQQLPKLGATLAWTLNDDKSTIDFAFSAYADNSCTSRESGISDGGRKLELLDEADEINVYSFHLDTQEMLFQARIQDAAPSSDGWVGWGINPTGLTMIGTQALIAFKASEGPVVYTYNLTMDIMSGVSLKPSRIGLNFTDTAAVINGTQVTIFATLNLKRNESLEMNNVWNSGSSVDLSTNSPVPHSFTGENIQSVSSINLTTGVTRNVELPHQTMKNRHGVISAVSWGFLLPLGIMASRYLRPFSGSNPLWFYVHVTCQFTGYILGVAGWALGLKLQNYNESAIHYKHRNLGVSIFAFATLQILAVFLRPSKQNNVRKYWNIYHHVLGYTTLILILINVFEGIDILQPDNKWRNAYIALVTILGGVSLVLEVITWGMWLRRPRNTNPAHVAQTGSSLKRHGFQHGQDKIDSI